MRRMLIACLLALGTCRLMAQTNVTTTTGGTPGIVPVFTTNSHNIENSPIAVSGGNVGIGTTSPIGPLEVYGGGVFSNFSNAFFAIQTSVPATTAAGQSVSNYFNNFNNNAGMLLRKTSTGNGDYLDLEGSSNNPIFIVKSSGNVGIGTTTPGSILNVVGSDWNGFLLTSSVDSYTMGTLKNDPLGTDVPGKRFLVLSDETPNTDGSNGGIMFRTNNGPNYGSPAPAMVIRETKNVGIGTTAPLSPLSVSGQVVIGTPYQGDASLQIDAEYGCCGRLTQISPALPSQNALNLMASNDSTGAGHFFSWGVNNGSWNINPGQTFGAAPAFTISPTGQVGIGTNISFADGTVQSTAWTGALCGGDYAESVDVAGERAQYEPGDVMVVDPANPGGFLKSAEAYSTLVAGIYSTKPGVVGKRFTDPERLKEELPMAMVGIVPAKVSAENGQVKPGDLLVTSSMAGYVMKGTDRERMMGAIVGKALGSVASGTAVIEVLVSLQ